MLFWSGVVFTSSVLAVALTALTCRPFLSALLSAAAVTVSFSLVMKSEGGAMWLVGTLFVGLVCIPVAVITAFTARAVSRWFASRRGVGR